MPKGEKMYLQDIMLNRLMIVCIVFMFHCDSPTVNNNMQQNVLTLTSEIPLPNVIGRIDHIAFDSSNQLAFIAALGNNTVEVVNTSSKKEAHTIKGLREPQGICYIASLHRLVVANGDDGTVVFYDATNFEAVGTIQLKGDADNVRYDNENGMLYVGYGSGAIAIINAVVMKLVTSIPLDGHPESFQLSKTQNRIYINVPDANEIEVADLNSHSVTSKWKNTNTSSNFPMALDDKNKRLFVACRSPATLRMIDTETGKDIQSINCSADADDVFYDAADNLVFISAGKGYIDVFKVANELTLINHIPTRSGARTSVWLSSERKLLLAVPVHNGDPAALWVYAINK